MVSRLKPVTVARVWSVSLPTCRKLTAVVAVQVPHPQRTRPELAVLVAVATVEQTLEQTVATVLQTKAAVVVAGEPAELVVTADQEH